MKILAITVGGLEDGSTKYRLGQYLPLLAARGVSVQIVHRRDVDAGTVHAGRDSDLILIQKSLFRTGMEQRIYRTGTPVVYDFDDAIWTRPGRPRSLTTRIRQHRRLHFWLRNAHVVIPANQYLATYARRFSSRVQVLPMAVDTNVWRPPPSSTDGSGNNCGLTIGWAGSPGNLPYLRRIAPQIAAVLRDIPGSRFRVYCGEKPDFAFPFDHVPYSPGTEAAFVQTLDIGLLPLPNTDHARGKSPIKSLQYLACGVPVVGNFVGATREICRSDFCREVSATDDWNASIRSLATDREVLRRMGAAGREFVERNHSLAGCAVQLLGLFEKAVLQTRQSAR